MNLYIDTTEKICKVGIGNEQTADIKTWQWQEDTGTELLERIDQLMKEKRIKLSNLKKVAVNAGPGSYTGTRVGRTVGKALAFTLNISYQELSTEGFDSLIKK